MPYKDIVNIYINAGPYLNKILSQLKEYNSNFLKIYIF